MTASLADLEFLLPLAVLCLLAAVVWWWHGERREGE